MCVGIEGRKCGIIVYVIITEKDGCSVRHGRLCNMERDKGGLASRQTLSLNFDEGDSALLSPLHYGIPV